MVTLETVLFIIIGYLCGSVLFGRVSGKIFHKNITGGSVDGVPGATNAYKYGGFLCGTLTLAGDVLKGLIPVLLFLSLVPDANWVLSAFVIASPVIGHILPVFYRFKGGKGNSTTFGVLFALIPVLGPFIILAATFIILSVVIRVTPHYYTLIVTYIITLILVVIGRYGPAVTLGFIVIAVAVLIRMFASREEKEKLKVRFLCMH